MRPPISVIENIFKFADDNAPLRSGRFRRPPHFHALSRGSVSLIFIKSLRSRVEAPVEQAIISELIGRVAEAIEEVSLEIARI